MEPVLTDFQKANTKLTEVLKLQKSEVVRDSAIKRFEICFDLAWKSIKAVARKEGVECYSPRECFKVAFQLRLIDYEKKWLEMLKDRNKIVHIYEEDYADEIYAKLGQYAPLFESLATQISNRLPL